MALSRRTKAYPAPKGVSKEEWMRLTPFTQRVYLAALRIPKGETRSYHWVAKESGKPKAMRAVGNALHRNPFAPTIPCHRVVKADGSLGGYAHGISRKRALLRQEGWVGW